MVTFSRLGYRIFPGLVLVFSLACEDTTMSPGGDSKKMSVENQT